MTKIKFGTDGWRAIIAKDFTVDNVAKVSVAVAIWLNKKYKNPTAVVGYDFRFGGKMFAETVATVLAKYEIKVKLCNSAVSTPAVSLAVVKEKAQIGIMITASHNPPDYNGYKLKGDHGGPLLEEGTKEIEAIIPEEHGLVLESLKIDELIKTGFIKVVDLEEMYLNHVYANFDIEALRKSKFKFAFDAMYGAGQNVMRKLFPDIALLHCENNPSFCGIAPEPLHKNLLEFSNFIANSGKIDCGLAVDGDADRIALYDGKGNYINSHLIILILTYYLAEYKKLKGKVVTGFSSTVKVEKLCEKYNIPVQRVKIGFKDICKVMLHEDVLVGGEESGGITCKGHIPERDGVWMGLTIWQFMNETGKNITQIIDEIYKITGTFFYSRNDLKIEDKVKNKVIQACKNDMFKEFGEFKVEHLETLDGYKYFINENEWIMIRPSGTEPLLRLYAETSTPERLIKFHEEALKAVNSLNT
ncbi:MAG: phosphoglucomutase/phosphomannomutase family protein [Bacteroidia bacterium]|nr:phosphoglucomutase/phosphomannomutase family protein [Bacteroidia bacterium]